MCIYFFERIFGDSYFLCFFYLTLTGISPISSPSGVGDASFPSSVTIGGGRCVRPLFVTIGLDPMVQVNQSSKTKKRCS